MAEEVWKTIPAFPNYEASNLGRIKSIQRTCEFLNRWGTITTRSVPEKVLGMNGNHGDYLMVQVEGANRQVHRLIANAWLGLDYDNKELDVHHENRNRHDNKPDNLIIKPKSEHVKDRLRTEVLKKALTVVWKDLSITTYASRNDLIHELGISSATAQRLLQGYSITKGNASNVKEVIDYGNA